VFATLLPGVRHIRAPLAAGFLWLLGVWLLVADHLPAKEDATGGLHTLVDIGDRMGRISQGVVAAFAAYIVGAAAAQFFGRFTGELSRFVQFLRGLPPFETEGVVSGDPGILFTATAESSIKAAASDRLGETRRRALASAVDADSIINVTTEFSDQDDWMVFQAENERQWDKWDFLIDQARKRSVYEFELLATRLMTTQPELFGELDRHRAEAELRYQLVFPLIFVDIALAITWTPWIVLALPLVGFLFVQGMYSAQRAGDIVADAVLIGQVTPPAVERVIRITDELIQAKPSEPEAA
jgi:hypothetical protein